MTEGEVRAAQENEAMTGGRPTWEMKSGKFTREEWEKALKDAKTYPILRTRH